MTAGLTMTSSRMMDDLIKALVCDSGLSKPTVSRICGLIDRSAAPVRSRNASLRVPGGATCVKARIDHQVMSRALVMAMGATVERKREVLGVGDSLDAVFADRVDNRPDGPRSP